MNLSSIQGRFTLLLVAFSLLVIVSVGVTIWSLETQRRDASVMNLAGRQRMLAQQMTREALEIGLGEGGPHIQNLQEAIQTFESTLTALRNGGPAPYLPGGSVVLPPTRARALLTQLDEVQATWLRYKDNLRPIVAEPPASPAFQAALRQIESLSAKLVQDSDTAVRLYESASTQKVVRLRWVQFSFLVCALLLLTVGSWMMRRTVIDPLQNLGSIARRIGGGNLTTPVEVGGLQETRVLEDQLDQMRAQLQASQEQAQAWTDQLEQRVSLRTQELEALYAVSREISSHLAINDVLRSITQKTKELLDCDIVFLCLFNQSDQSMSLRAASGPEPAIARRTSPIDATTTGQVLAGDRALRCDDQGCRGYCEILAMPYRTSHIAAPLKVEQQIIGALCVGSEQPDRFGEEAIDVLTKLANVAAVALLNARLYDQAERLAASEERQRIAAEMHDGLAQTLSYTKLAVNQAELHVETGQVDKAVTTLEGVNSALDQAIEDTRRTIASLQELGPLVESLQEQLADLAVEFSGGSPAVKWTSEVEAPLMLPRQESQQVLGVVREALLNAKRHSGAARISLCLAQGEGEYCLSIADDGKGFNPSAPADDDNRQHFGVNIMHARAARIAGRLEIQSAPGSGTRVSLYWPVRKEAA
jgi:two-component system nitrate/nitrite sensor histidine kinase NarX